MLLFKLLVYNTSSSEQAKRILGDMWTTGFSHP